jgi:hypothetical protein
MNGTDTTISSSSQMTPTYYATVEQPKPVKNNLQPSYVRACEWLRGKGDKAYNLIDAIEARNINKSEGDLVRPNNGVNPVLEAYQLSLDKLVRIAQMSIDADIKKLPEEPVVKLFYAEANMAAALYELIESYEN